MMGGDITLTSEKGVGSVFTLLLPRESSEHEDLETDTVLADIDDD